MHQIILASRNSGKLQEIQALLRSLRLDIKSISDFSGIPGVVEDADTLEGNALKKARESFRLTKISSLADDSGLEVFCLGMRPGVFSARYAGENVSYAANNIKLLTEMKGVSLNQRKARFRCVAAFVDGNVEKVIEGVCSGTIIEEEHGTGGFGYDPLFVPDGFNLTFAELSMEIKNRISHRSQAFLAMKDFLHEYFLLP